MLAIGFPIGAQQFLETLTFATVAMLMGRLGATQMAAHQVAINLASLTFMVPTGIATAGAVLVGHAIGRGDAAGARRAAKAALFCGVGFMTLSAIAFVTFPHAIAAVYTSDMAVIALAVVLIPIAGIFQVFDGTQAVSAGILRGIGDTRAPAIANFVGFWLIGMPVSLYLGFHTRAGPVGLWWGFVVGLAAVATVLLLRVRIRFRSTLTRLNLGERTTAEHPIPH
jgi:MATE family multidrug resistance protein